MKPIIFILFFLIISLQIHSQIIRYNSEDIFDKDGNISEKHYFYWENGRLWFVFSDSIDETFDYISYNLQKLGDANKLINEKEFDINFYGLSFSRRLRQNYYISKKKEVYRYSWDVQGLGKAVVFNPGTQSKPGKGCFKPDPDIVMDSTYENFNVYIDNNKQLIMEHGPNKAKTIYKNIDIKEKYNHFLHDVFYRLCINNKQDWFYYVNNIDDPEYLRSFLEYLNKDEIRYFRNMLYAVNGYKFNDPELLNTFKRYNW